MATDNSNSPPSQQAIDIGRAGRALRERAGMTQDDVADALGVRRQAIQNYEAGIRHSILRTDLQDRWAKAMGVTREDLLREVARQAGMPSGLERRPPEPSGSGDVLTYELPVTTRSRPSDEGPTLYGVAEPDTIIDMSWMFGATARTLRMVGDRMSGYVESGQLVVYDVSVWPKKGDGCVVELVNGEAHVAEYVESGQGVLKVKFRQPAEEKSFPMAEVKGAYIIRFRGS
jgi:transcriptional regulator with XRE-family HTH domain